jgi:hypothetical protein
MVDAVRNVVGTAKPHDQGMTFAGHVRSELDLGQLRSALIDTAGEAVSPVTATVWLRGVSR